MTMFIRCAVNLAAASMICCKKKHCKDNSNSYPVLLQKFDGSAQLCAGPYDRRSNRTFNGGRYCGGFVEGVSPHNIAASGAIRDLFLI